MRRRLLIPGLLVAGLLAAAPARAASITFDSLPANPNPGDVFTLGVRVTEIDDLFTFGFDLTFDPTVLRATSIDEGDFLTSAVVDPVSGGTVFIPGEISDGLVNVTLGTLFGPEQLGASGSGALAFITFQALAGGTSILALSNVFLLDSTIPQGTDISADVLNGTVTVEQPTPVPEPSTVGLLGVGLAALARRLRRKAPVAS